MKERPILFSGPMVRAILEGRKTQTRHVVVFLPEYARAQYVRIKHDARISKFDPVVSISHADAYAACPFGEIGDRLWVRETFSAYAPTGQEGNWKTGENVTYVYRADDENADVARWYPCIFLPRHASRITLEITNVRVEQLWDIAEVDAQHEGMIANENILDALRMAFKDGWDKLNAKRGYGWEKNPVVWVLSLRVVK